MHATSDTEERQTWAMPSHGGNSPPALLETMPRYWRSAFERIVRCLRQSAESFAAAAAVYGPDLMLRVEATRSCGAGAAAPSCHEAHFGDRRPSLRQRRPPASDRMGWRDGLDRDLGGAGRCPGR